MDAYSLQALPRRDVDASTFDRLEVLYYCCVVTSLQSDLCGGTISTASSNQAFTTHTTAIYQHQHPTLACLSLATHI